MAKELGKAKKEELQGGSRLERAMRMDFDKVKGNKLKALKQEHNSKMGSRDICDLVNEGKMPKIDPEKIKATRKRIKELLQERKKDKLTITTEIRPRCQIYDWLNANMHTLLTEALGMAMMSSELPPQSLEDKIPISIVDGRRYKFEMLRYLIGLGWEA